jgi:hypothetical protein
LELLVPAVPTYIDAREGQKLQSFPEISQNHPKTPIPGQKGRRIDPAFFAAMALGQYIRSILFLWLLVS